MRTSLLSLFTGLFIFGGKMYCECLPPPVPLLSIGGGCFDMNHSHMCGLAQLEYKCGTYFWHGLRPQATLVIPGFHSVFAGVGIGWEIYLLKHLVFFPNFCPGIYFHSSKGKRLGSPVEFRSALELSYEFCGAYRLGGQFYHISNAHLSNHNPGANAFVFFIALPLKFLLK